MSRSLYLKGLSVLFSVSVFAVGISGCDNGSSDNGQPGMNGQPPGGYPGGGNFPQGYAPQKIVVRYYAQTTCYSNGYSTQPVQNQNGYGQQYPFQGPGQNSSPQFNGGNQPYYSSVEYALVNANSYGAYGAQSDVNTMVNQGQLQFSGVQGQQLIQSSYPYSPTTGSPYFLRDPSQQWVSPSHYNNGYNNGSNNQNASYNNQQNYIRAACNQQMGYYSYQNYCSNQQFVHYYYSLVNNSGWSYLPTYFWQNSYYYYIPETWFCSGSYMYLVYKSWW